MNIFVWQKLGADRSGKKKIKIKIKKGIKRSVLIVESVMECDRSSGDWIQGLHWLLNGEVKIVGPLCIESTEREENLAKQWGAMETLKFELQLLLKGYLSKHPIKNQRAFSIFFFIIVLRLFIDSAIEQLIWEDDSMFIKCRLGWVVWERRRVIGAWLARVHVCFFGGKCLF